MATVTPVSSLITTLYGHVLIWTWSNISSGDTLGAAPMGPYRDRSVHCYDGAGGAWGGSTISIFGSNEPTLDDSVVTNYVILHDPQDIALTFTDDKIEEISEITHWIKPTCTAGTGNGLVIHICTAAVL